MNVNPLPKYVGVSVPRVNDEMLMRGGGGFVGDIDLPEMAHAVVVRAPIAHALLRSVNAADAAKPSGIIDIITPETTLGQLKPIRCVRLFEGQLIDSYPALDRRIRYVGQPVAIVVGESRALAEDAVELLRLEYEELDPIVTVDQAMADGAPLLYPELETNVVVQVAVGDPADAIEAALGKADHVISRTFRIQRIAPTPLEPRGLIASWEASAGRLTVYSSSQTPHHVRDAVAYALGLPTHSVRVVVQGVGGGFGAKEHLYPDELLVCLASQRCRRPVRWLEDRSESFVSTLHARDQVYQGRLALDRDGHFVALSAEITANLGAHPSNVGQGPAYAGQRMLEGPYRFEVSGSSSVGVVTCTTPTGAYRGFGMQESSWVRERLVDEAARELGLDPVELRLKNMPKPGEFPFQTRSGQVYDSGDYSAALNLARASFEATLEKSNTSDHKRRGVGVASYVEMTGLAPSRVLQRSGFDLHGYETAIVRMDPDGSVVVNTGTCPHGQGLETTLAQLAADRLGVDMDSVRVVFGDTAVAPYSATATIASRSMVVGGAAVIRAATQVRRQLQVIGAHLFETSLDDIEIVDGSVRVRGSPTVSRTVAEVAAVAWGGDIPAGTEPGLEAKIVHEPMSTAYAYASHMASVAVDPETGHVQLEGYVVVHDCGTIVNPAVVSGQVHGGVAQGIGNALYEEVPYADDGQPLTSTFLNYILPGSGEVPDIKVFHLETVAPDVPGGMKGMGEGGTIGPAPAIGNAIANAIPEVADKITETPLSPSLLWGLLHDHEV